MSDDHRAELDRHFVWFEAKLPPRPARFVGWLRKPSSKVVRVPVAVLLIGGGVLSFLPVLGLWMLPLGLVLIAQDVPVLEKPTARSLGWIERKWKSRQSTKGIGAEGIDGAPVPANDDREGNEIAAAVHPKAHIEA